MTDDNKIPRRDYIAMIMERQGVHKNPRKYVVLRGWNLIVDHDATYEVQTPPLPERFEVGQQVYAIVRPDNPELEEVRVVEDRGAGGVFVEPFRGLHRVQFLVPRDDVKLLPIPLRPLAIPRADLRLYIGDEAATAWHAQRRARREQPRPAQE